MGQQFLRRSESNPPRTAAFRDTRYTHRGENVERFGVPSGSKLNSQTGGCGDRPATGTETDAAISSDTPTRLPAFLSPSLFPPPIPNFSSTFLRRQAFRDFSTFHRYFFFFHLSRLSFYAMGGEIVRKATFFTRDSLIPRTKTLGISKETRFLWIDRRN